MFVEAEKNLGLPIHAICEDKACARKQSNEAGVRQIREPA